MNFSNQTSPSRLKSIVWHIEVVYLFLTIFAALIGNLLVLGATYLDKRLHHASKYFVASLAIADLLVAMLSVTVRLHIFLHSNQLPTLTFCRFYIWADIFTEAASITTLTMISIDRYYKVSRPFRYKAKMTTHLACRILALVWIYSAVLGVFSLIPYGGNKAVHVTTNHCENENKTFYTLAALLGFFIPVGILIVLCILIFRIVQAHSRKRLPSNDETARIHQKHNNSNRRSLMTLTLIVLTFITCWGPFFVLFVIHQFNPQTLASIGGHGLLILRLICNGILPYANSFLNPIIYAFLDKTFNVAIKDMLLRLCKNSRSHSASQHSTVRLSRFYPRTSEQTSRHDLQKAAHRQLLP